MPENLFGEKSEEPKVPETKPRGQLIKEYLARTQEEFYRRMKWEEKPSVPKIKVG